MADDWSVRTARGGLVAIVLVLLALAVLAAPPGGTVGMLAGGGGGARAGGQPGSAPTGAAGRDTTAIDGPVTIAFGGDVHFESWLGDAVRSDPEAALTAMRPLFTDADVAVVNLETAVTERGTPSPKQYNFRAPDDGLAALAAAGVDVVSIANNHGMDYGVQGLRDTVTAAAASEVALIGGGLSAGDAYRPHVVTVHGRRIAVLAATQVLDSFAVEAWTATADRPGLASAKEARGGLARLEAAVRTAAGDADTVAVMLHWGREGETCPLPRQRDLADRLRDAGADIIVGGHAHRVAGGGWSGDAAVHYGLGNLVFYARSGPGTTSGALHVTIAPDGRMRQRWHPAELRDGIATPLDDDHAVMAIAAWEDLRGCTDLAALPGRGPS